MTAPEQLAAALAYAAEATAGVTWATVALLDVRRSTTGTVLGAARVQVTPAGTSWAIECDWTELFDDRVRAGRVAVGDQVVLLAPGGRPVITDLLVKGARPVGQ